METQNYKNHTRMHPLYHYVLSVLLLGMLISAVIHAINAMSSGKNVFQAFIILLTAVSVVIIGVLVRTYTLKAQDRAIRAEENLRHYVLTGKMMNPSLTVKQAVALRFASDKELPALSEKAAAENLKPDDIKKLIQDWRADHYRI
ncbi:hypothetical protein J9317_17405 [Metabacillus sp. KIGAM252]|uniref:ABC transporter permease n=1 Tax=Metabacillus flavus TaxID=2823519 RepID=A0ABS5LIE5_9BACI|nr:DUF6526 family protein [Metabacillus flavus]MBS2970526.1 hypothetical protein [Metabacillus flavus]